jgi:hypothetical protein
MLVISIILEAAVAVVAVLAARRRNPYIYGLAFTFGAYVLYDLARLLQWDVQGNSNFSQAEERKSSLGRTTLTYERVGT